MAYEVLLPKLGQTVEESRIVEWLKAEGDPVERGDVLFTVETDKAVLDVEAPRKGFLRKIIAPAGEMLPVLSLVGLITRTADEPIEAEAAGTAASGAAASEAPKAAPSVPTFAEPSTTSAPGPLLLRRRARKAAADRGIDVAQSTGQARVGGSLSVTCWGMPLRRPRSRQWRPHRGGAWCGPVWCLWHGPARTRDEGGCPGGRNWSRYHWGAAGGR